MAQILPIWVPFSKLVDLAVTLAIIVELYIFNFLLLFVMHLSILFLFQRAISSQWLLPGVKKMEKFMLGLERMNVSTETISYYNVFRS